MLGGNVEMGDDILKAALDISKTSAPNDTTSGWYAGAVAAAIEQPVVQRAVAQLVDRQNPLRVNLPRIGGSGAKYRYTQRTAASTLANFADENTDPVRSLGQRTLVEYAYKTIVARGRIGRVSAKVSASLYNVLNDEIMARVDDFRDFEDLSFIRGLATDTADANAFGGLDYLLGLKGKAALAQSSQVIDGGSIGGQYVVGSTLTAAMMDRLTDAVTMGQLNALLMSRAGRRGLLKLIHALGHGYTTVTVAGGHILPSWNGVPIFISTNIADACKATAAQTTYSAYTGGTFSTIYAASWDELFVSELTPVTTMPLAQVSSVYQDFDIFCDEVLVYRRYGGLAAFSFVNLNLGAF